MTNRIFISYASRNQAVAEKICAALEQAGLACWIAPRDVEPGASYQNAIFQAIKSSGLILLLVTSESNISSHVLQEVELGLERQIPVLPVRLDGAPLSGRFNLAIGRFQFVEASKVALDQAIQSIVQAAGKVLPPCKSPGNVVSEVRTAQAGKGYVFISYSRSDMVFVERLKGILKSRGYAYWDYSESERDYHGALYRELEEKIEGAAAFMCVVTDSWRATQWPAAEYIYAKEAKVPVFVIQAGKLDRPVPILLNQQTRIDMATDFERGAIILGHELDKKSL